MMSKEQSASMPEIFGRWGPPTQRARCWLLLFAMLLGGCASIPLATLSTLSSMNLQTVGQIDPSELRVRMSLPRGFSIDIASFRLVLVAGGPKGTSTTPMSVRLIGRFDDSRPGGWFSADVPVSTYLLALDNEALEPLRAVQAAIASDQAEFQRFEVAFLFETIPEGARDVTFWVDLQLQAGGPFLPLFDHQTLLFQESPPAR